MTPFAAVALKAAGGAAVAALLSAGVVSAANPPPSPSGNAATQQASHDRHADRRTLRRAVVDAEADVLGVKPEALARELRRGEKVSDLAHARGMTKAQFAIKLIANLRPRLEALVDHHMITRPQADRVLDRIATGRVPFWNGIAHPEK